jgi:transcriptional regulator with XRE-family HTH domain
MQHTGTPPYSRYSREAVELLGKLIRVARTEHKMTTTEVSERAGISRGRLQRIEKGEMTSEIGAVFEVAAIVGLKLFDADETGLSRLARQTEDKLTLLPKSVRKKQVVVKDDF